MVLFFGMYWIVRIPSINPLMGKNKHDYRLLKNKASLKPQPF